MSLIRHHYDCIDNLYPCDMEVLDKYKNYRLISLAVDSMRLNLFHKDNQKPKATRKSEFINFINTEPFKSAINDYDSDSAWWGWIVPIRLAKKSSFATLDFLFKHWLVFKLYGGLSRIFRKIKK